MRPERPYLRPSSGFNEARADSPGKSRSIAIRAPRTAGFNEARADSPGKFIWSNSNSTGTPPK